VLRRLHGSQIPVPALLASEPSSAPLGAPFVVMEWVDAPHMGNAPDASFAAFTKAVTTIHNLDWKARGLDFLGVPGSPREALRSEIEMVAARMRSFGCGEDRQLVAAQEMLLSGIPNDGRLALCQGDINVFNYLFRDGVVVAVVDWEQARISDPRSDIGQLVALSHLKGAPFGPADEQGFVLAYGGTIGAPVTGMAFFRAFWLFQLAVIYHGWVSFNASEPWYSLRSVTELLEASLAEIS